MKRIILWREVKTVDVSFLFPISVFNSSNNIPVFKDNFSLHEVQYSVVNKSQSFHNRLQQFMAQLEMF